MTDPSNFDAIAYRLDAVSRGFLFGLAFTPLEGKRPIQRGWSTSPKPGCESVFRWARNGNVGARTGQISGLVAVDADVGADVSVLNLPDTPTAITGGGGHHYFFRAPDEPTRNSAGQLGAKIDFRGDGGQVVFPGSIHPETGQMYRWATGRALGEIPLADLPEEILTIVRRNASGAGEVKTQRHAGAAQSSRYGMAALDREADLVRLAPEGTRNSTLNRAAFNVGQLVAGGELVGREAVARLFDASPLPEQETKATIASGLTGGSRNPRSADSTSPGVASSSQEPAPNRSEMGNGQRLVQLHGDDIRYCYPLKSWFVWSSTRWREDKTGEIQRRAKDTIRALYEEAAQSADSDERKCLAKWALQSEKNNALKAMIELAQSEPGVAILPEAFDKDSWLFNVENGTLDLRRQALRPHRRLDLMTKCVPVLYDSDSKCGLWQRFLAQCTGHRDELAGYVQRVVGYCLTGDTSEQCFFILHGKGANGKSVFLNVLRRLMGDYAEQTPQSTFVARKPDSGSHDLAKLRGARLVSISETEQGEHLAESLIKQVTGQDAVTARPMYKEFFTYTPRFKVLMATNHRPQIRGTDLAIWRRIRLIPFEISVPPEKQDRHLTEKLLDELPGILAWAVEGCRQWLELGLADPQIVRVATANYRRSEDRILAFLEECCEVGPKFRSTAADLLDGYHHWCRESGDEPMSQKAFGGELTREGFRREKGSSGRIVWYGIALRPEVRR